MRRLLFAMTAVWLGVGCRPRPGDGEFVLRIATLGPFAKLAPTTQTTYAAAAGDLVYETLFRPGAQGELTSRLLDGWNRLGLRSYRIRLASGPRFSDGSPLTLDDAVRSLTVIGFKVLREGDWLEIEADPTQPPELAILFAPIFKETSAGALGTGPFRVAGQSADRISLERVVPSPRRIQRVELLGYASARDVFARTLRGEANAAIGLDERQSELLEGIPSLKVLRTSGPHAVSVLLNARRFTADVRRSLLGALASAHIGEVLGPSCHGSIAPSDGMLPVGRPLEVLTAGVEPAFHRVGLAARRAWGERGGQIKMVDAAAHDARLEAHQFDATVMALLASPPALQALYWTTGAPWNWGGYSNHRVDEAFARGDVAAALSELERDPPALYLCRRERIGAVDSRIRNPSLGSWGLLDTLPDWEVEP